MVDEVAKFNAPAKNPARNQYFNFDVDSNILTKVNTKNIIKEKTDISPPSKARNRYQLLLLVISLLDRYPIPLPKSGFVKILSSALSHNNIRIKRLEFSPSASYRELPIYTSLFAIAG